MTRNMDLPPIGPLSRRIGIHGVRSAGKTCFLGSLYGHRTTPAGRIACASDETIQYLAAVWKELSSGRVPGATMLAMPTALRLTVELPDRPDILPVELCDYAGQLVQPRGDDASPVAHTLTEGVKEWFRGCHAVLIFLDVSRPDMQQLDALDLLLSDLRTPRGGKAALERPLGLVLTKWDSQGAVSDDLDREVERARDFLAGHHVFRQMHDKLSELDGDRVRLFPVSAFGNHARNGAPPALHLYQPCHLLAPLEWAARMADLVVLEDARRVASRHLARAYRVFDLPVWPRPDHAGALTVWRDLRESLGNPEGELGAAIDREVEVLHHGRGHHWLRNTLVGLAIVLGLGALVHQGNAEARSRASQVELFRDEHPRPEDAALRIDRTDAFLASWWSYLAPGLRRDLTAARQVDALAIEEMEERPGTLARGAELAKQDRWQELFVLYSGYVERFPDSPARSILDQGLEQAGERIERNLALEEGKLLEASDRLDDALARYRGFVQRYPRSVARPDFDDRIRTLTRTREDRAEYEAIRRLAQGANAVSLEKAAGLASVYLGSNHPTRTMRREVERFWSWFDGLRKGREFFIEVESLQIPPGSALDPFLGKAEPRVHIALGGTTHATDWLKGKNLTPGQKLGPFTFRWGQPATLRVRVESWRRFGSNEWATGEAADPCFVLTQASGSFVTRCKKNRAVLVGLRCNAAVPPALPPYGRR